VPSDLGVIASLTDVDEVLDDLQIKMYARRRSGYKSIGNKVILPGKKAG